MQVYFSTFITGTKEIIEKTIKKNPEGKFKIIYLLDGLILYETRYSIREIRNIRFFNNSFICLELFEELSSDPLSQMIRETTKDARLKYHMISKIPGRKRTFKIVTSLENRFVSANRSLVKKLEAKISEITNLTLDIKKPDLEFWFLARREGIGLFGIRITYNRPLRKYFEKGQLRQELAHILCLVSDPLPHDVFLDPFAGWGAIPIEGVTSFPFRKVIAIDSNSSLVKKLKRKAGKIGAKMIIEQGDALHLNIRDASVEKIVTDPPWGIYKETKIPLRDFYHQMLKEFYRVLRLDGIAVVLIGNKMVFEEALDKVAGKLTLLSKYNILVSGKKAAIYQIKKTPK